MAKNMKFHLTYECPLRIVACWFCGEECAMDELEEHLRQDCPDTLVRRKFAARAALGIELVECALCERMVPRRRLESHQFHRCPERLVTCPNDGCRLRLRAVNLKRHLLEWCEDPTAVTQRGLSVRARKLRPYDRSWEGEEEQPDEPP